MQLTLQIIANGLLLGGLYALLAVGLTLIFGVLRVVNFAHAEFMMLGMFGTYWIWRTTGLDPYLATLLVVPVIFALGIVVDRVVIQRTIGAPEVTVVFATLGLSILLQNAALTAWSADIRSVSTDYGGMVMRLAGVRISVPMAISFGVAMLASLALWLFLTRTLYGKAVQAVAQNREAAALMGIDVRRVYMWTFATAVAAAGAMGGLVAPLFTVYPTVGSGYIVAVFVIVVLGGLGSVPGAVLAAFVIGLTEAVAGFFLGTAWAELATFLIFLAVLVVRPQGFFGRRGAETFGGR
ncbi:MAG: branched-chain amino acid ABC transporter permease [Alkalilacustris sp.]